MFVKQAKFKNANFEIILYPNYQLENPQKHKITVSLLLNNHTKEPSRLIVYSSYEEQIKEAVEKAERFCESYSENGEIIREYQDLINNNYKVY